MADISEEIYLNPITDFGFKKIFGEPDVMQDLLNDLIHSRGIKSDIIEIELMRNTFRGNTTCIMFSGYSL